MIYFKKLHISYKKNMENNENQQTNQEFQNDQKEQVNQQAQQNNQKVRTAEVVQTNEKEKKLFASDSRCTVYRTFRKLDKCLCFFSSQTAKRRVRTNCTARTLLLLSLHR